MGTTRRKVLATRGGSVSPGLPIERLTSAAAAAQSGAVSEGTPVANCTGRSARRDQRRPHAYTLVPRRTSPPTAIRKRTGPPGRGAECEQIVFSFPRCQFSWLRRSTAARDAHQSLAVEAGAMDPVAPYETSSPPSRRAAPLPSSSSAAGRAIEIARRRQDAEALVLGYLADELACELAGD